MSILMKHSTFLAENATAKENPGTFIAWSVMYNGMKIKNKDVLFVDTIDEVLSYIRLRWEENPGDPPARSAEKAFGPAP